MWMGPGEAAVRKDPDQQVRWIFHGRTGRHWHIRPEGYILRHVADRAGVKYRVHYGYNYPVGGRGSPMYSFDAADARRVAPDVIGGVIDVDPTWRTDTPEGHRIHRWNRLKLFLSVTAYLSPLLAAFVLLIIAFVQ
ncbi:hypothetical protein [Streptomyces sp. NPDC001833]|uniref:hypothetical protein n=1 Tax=Streptomyces sp. NPDC001833 TaxID=3154658 RepID=UPI003320817A